MSYKQNLEELGIKILNASRTELFLSMRFMGSALDSLAYTIDLTTRTAGTDAVYIRFNPEFLMRLYLMHPRYLNRLYVHMILHCIFRHMFAAPLYEDAELFDLCADITVESILDTMEYSAVQTTHSDFRDSWYETLNREVKVLTAERLYKYFSENPPEYSIFCKLKDEFARDDHSFWERLEDRPSDDNENKNNDELPPETPDQKNQPPGAEIDPKDQKPREDGMPDTDRASVHKLPKELEDEWKKKADRVKVEMEAVGNEASDEFGSLLRTLKFVQKKRKGYKHFLKRFASIHEETKIDPDSFDYAFYQYGMELYGNIPLIEENEYRDSKKIRTLVIAIDTSASCQDRLVQRFLNETADILLRQETFFRKAEIVVIECDDRVQNEIFLKSPEELKKYADGFEVHGGFGTDFRPVFREIEELKSKGRLSNLKGLMYFTDGFGTFPEKPAPWETAFVLFKDDDCETELIPDWAYTLYLEGD